MVDERRELRGATLDGAYYIEGVLGVGGTSVVFDARRLDDGRAVAIKTLREKFAYHPDLIRRLRREAEVARGVVHPGIVHVFDDGTLPDGTPYIVLERLEGTCMITLLRRAGTLPAEEVAVIMARVSAVLHAAHVAGYVHRDMKPEHVVLDRAEDCSLDVRVLDFGVCASAHAEQQERERERGRVFGTPSYVSPEQASGNPEIDGRADIFGLGICMFEALTGSLPFSGSTISNLLRSIIRDQAPPPSELLPELDPAMDAIVERALSNDAEARFPTARALARALLSVVEDRRAVERSIASKLTEPVMPLVKTRRRRRVVAA